MNRFISTSIIAGAFAFGLAEAKTGSLDDLRATIERADAQQRAGDLEDSIASYKSAIAIVAEHLPSDRATRGGLQYRKAEILKRLGRHTELPGAYREALSHLDGAGGSATEAARIARLNFARYLVTRDQFAEADKELKPLIPAPGQAFDPSLPEDLQASVLTTLGEIEFETLRWNDAYRNLESAISECEAVFGESDLATALAHNNMGRLLNRIGACDRAEDHLKKAMAIYAKHRLEQMKNLLNTGINLGETYVQRGDFDAATKNLETVYASVKEAAASDEGLETLLAHIGNQLGRAYFESGDNFDRATAQFAQAQNLIISKTGTFTPAEIATAHNSLGIAQLLSGDLTAAEASMQKALATLAPLSATHETYEQRFSAKFNHAMLLHHQKDRAGALRTAREAIATVETNYRDVFAHFAPGLRLAFSQRLVRYPFHLAGTLGDPELALEVALNHKGIVADSVARDRSMLAQVTEKDSLRRLAELQNEFANATLRNENTDGIRGRIQDLRARLIGSPVGERPISREELMAAIGEDEVIIDFFEYRNNQAAHGWRWDIGALVLRRGDEPSFYRITAEEIKQLRLRLAELRKRLERPDSISSKSGDPAAWCQAVFNLVLGKAGGALDGAKTLTLATDGILHDVPFAILRPPGKPPLVNTVSIRHINSLRDLLAAQPVRANDGSRRALLVGNPDFNLAPAARKGGLVQKPQFFAGLELASNSRALKIVIGEAMITPLPGTAKELAALAPLLQQSGYRVGRLAAEKCTEATVRKYGSGNTILHIATHGFYYDPSTRSGNASPLRDISDPMFRSGLTLAGATPTVAAWQNDRFPDATTDGILMASEIAELDLRDTQLVTLSACDTGQGQALGGQGVHGIRRALIEAGARNVVTTLWKIDDQGTVPLMLELYRKYTKGSPPHVALAEAQRELLKASQDSSPWSAIYDFAPFIVTSRGPLK